jgi:hypothetical protein
MRKRGRRFCLPCLILAFIGLCGSGWAVLQESQTSDLMKAADEVAGAVVQLRGLEPKAPIQKGVKSREEIFKYINERVSAEYDENELRSEGKLLQKLGLIPASLDYMAFTRKLLSEQVGGYYDPDQKTFFIAGWLPVAEQKPVMVHELTHALQDQYFDLNKIMNEDRAHNNDDMALAHQALMEGDAMATMINYLLEPAGRNFAQLPDLVFVMRSQFSSMNSQYAVFSSAPLFMKESLLFPYGYGAAFLQKAWAKTPSWEAINKIYSDLPASTEQVMHPEKYLTDRDAPKAVKIENPAALLGDGWKVRYRNVLGEFSLGLLLRLHLDEEPGRKAATGWGGDEAMLLENGSGGEGACVATVWDSPDDADRFFSAMGQWFLLQYPKARKQEETPFAYSLSQDGEYSSIRLEGARVTLMIGFPEAAMKKK